MRIKKIKEITNQMLFISSLMMMSGEVLSCDGKNNRIPIKVDGDRSVELDNVLDNKDIKIYFDLSGMTRRHTADNMKCYGEFSIRLSSPEIEDKTLAYDVLPQGSLSEFYLIFESNDNEYKLFIEKKNKKHSVLLGEPVELKHDGSNSDKQNYGHGCFSNPENYPITLEPLSGKINNSQKDKYINEVKERNNHCDHFSSRY